MKIIYSFLFLVISVQAFSQNKNASPTPKRFTLAAQAGYGHRVGSMDENITGELKNHANALRSGLSWNVEAGYQIDPNNVISLSYGMFSSSNQSGNFLMPAEQGNMLMASVNTRDRISLVMANFTNYFYTDPSEKFRVFGQAGIGMAMHRSDSEFKALGTSMDVNLNGSGFATNLGAGIDLKIAKNLYISGQVNYVMSRVKMKADDPQLNAELQGEDRESLNHIRAMAGLRVSL